MNPTNPLNFSNQKDKKNKYVFDIPNFKQLTFVYLINNTDKIITNSNLFVTIRRKKENSKDPVICKNPIYFSEYAEIISNKKLVFNNFHIPVPKDCIDIVIESQNFSNEVYDFDIYYES